MNELLAGTSVTVTVDLSPLLRPEATPEDPWTKQEAHYRLPQPRDANFDENIRCGTCAHYRANRCELVTGSINDNMLCDLWEA